MPFASMAYLKNFLFFIIYFYLHFSYVKIDNYCFRTLICSEIFFSSGNFFNSSFLFISKIACVFSCLLFLSSLLCCIKHPLMKALLAPQLFLYLSFIKILFYYFHYFKNSFNFFYSSPLLLLSEQHFA